MVPRSPAVAVLLCFSSLACTGPKQLETSVGTRRSEALVAEAKQVEGRWRVELRLPVGHWQVVPDEEQTFHIVPAEPRSVLVWTVAPDRWALQDRPFRFNLVGEGGLTIAMSVRYPNTLPPAVSVLLEIFARGAIPH
ncbi:MAG: hypothetical protein WCL47_03385 [Holophagaceae bacterium]